MAKLNHLIATIFFLTLLQIVNGQVYGIHYTEADKDTQKLENIPLKKVFNSKTEAANYIFQLPSFLQSNGYITASLDSVYYDSSFATVTIFIGTQYKWAELNTSPECIAVMEAIHWPSNSLTGNINFTSFRLWQQKVLDYFEERGHPFGKTYLDNISIDSGKVKATLRMDEGPIYKIDSIRVYGDAKVNNEFLQRYLEIANGSYYNRKKLQNVTRKLRELSYLQEERPSNLTLLGNGSILNLYLKAKKTSQINALIGFAPNTSQSDGTQKLLLTVDASILLRNALGAGETIGLVWQQLQQQSPRLNLIFDRPFIFHSAFGLNFSLDMYKQDSTYLNINMNLGTTYRIEDRQSVSIFLQRMQTIVNGVNLMQVMQTPHKLPPEADVSSLNLGLGYSFNNTDYRYNPRKGNEWTITATAGTKNIKRNAQILELKDSSFDYASLYDSVKLNVYQFRVLSYASHFIPLGSQSTLKLALNAGIYQSGNYYRNELFRIGGYKLLRGFDEESLYVSQYAIGTLEYRYQLGLNSYFFVFTDGGYGKHLLETVKQHTYIGSGLGLSFETKAGLINLAWAVGKRNDTQFNLRQSKVHLGFVSYF